MSLCLDPTVGFVNHARIDPLEQGKQSRGRSTVPSSSHANSGNRLLNHRSEGLSSPEIQIFPPNRNGNPELATPLVGSSNSKSRQHAAVFKGRTMELAVPEFGTATESETRERPTT
jgi:hypothetical protein